MDRIPSFLLVLGFATLSAHSAAAQQTWQCAGIEECSSTSGCDAQEGTFQVLVSVDGKTLAMLSPNRGPLSMSLAQSDDRQRSFEGKSTDLEYAIVLETDGKLTGTLNETMFWGGVITHTMTATCEIGQG